MIIVCAGHVAAGQVIMLLLQEGFLPISHFRLSEADDHPNHVIITVADILAAPYETELRAELAAIHDTTIQ